MRPVFNYIIILLSSGTSAKMGQWHSALPVRQYPNPMLKKIG